MWAGGRRSEWCNVFDADRKKNRINYCHYFETFIFSCLSLWAQKQLSGTTKDTKLFIMHCSTWIMSQSECCKWCGNWDDGSHSHSVLKLFLLSFFGSRDAWFTERMWGTGRLVLSQCLLLVLFSYCELSDMKMISWRGDIEQEFVVCQLVVASVHSAERCCKPTQTSVKRCGRNLPSS